MKLVRFEINDWLDQYKIMTISPLLKSVLLRFSRAFLAGAFSTMAIGITLSYSITNWQSLASWVSMLSLSFLVGGLSGLIQAGDKYFRSNSTNPIE